MLDRSQNLLLVKEGSEINLLPPGIISGVILDAEGKPIEGINVLACEYEEDEPYCVEGVSNA